MRKTLWAAALALLTGQAVSAQDHAQETITGNGHAVTRDVPVQPFTSLKASGVYELSLVQGDREGVRIEADENLQDLFVVRNEGDRLVIDMKELKNKSLNNKHKMKVYVTFRNLQSLNLSTVGNVTTESTLNFGTLDVVTSSVGNINLKLKADRLSLENKSVGNVHLAGTADDAVFRNKGVGSLQAASFVVQTLDIDNSGVGSAEVNAEKSLTVKDNMLGKVQNKGAAQARKLNKARI